MLNTDGQDERPASTTLLNNIKARLAELKELQRQCDDTGTDGVYRFYHGSFKVYGRLQPLTTKITEMFRSLDPKEEKSLDNFFERIVADGTGHTFELSHNQDWPGHTRPIVEAYFHCEYFLRQLVTSAALEYPPNLLPESWAAVLTLFNLR